MKSQTITHLVTLINLSSWTLNPKHPTLGGFSHTKSERRAPMSLKTFYVLLLSRRCFSTNQKEILPQKNFISGQKVLTCFWGIFWISWVIWPLNFCVRIWLRIQSHLNSFLPWAAHLHKSLEARYQPDRPKLTLTTHFPHFFFGSIFNSTFTIHFQSNSKRFFFTKHLVKSFFSTLLEISAPWW